MTDKILTLHNGTRPLSALSSPKEAIRQFTPNWFAATMGTGILSLSLAQFPWQVPGVRTLAEGLWMFNILLFIVFSLTYLARWVMYFDEAKSIFGHSTVSMVNSPRVKLKYFSHPGGFRVAIIALVHRLFPGIDRPLT